MARAIYSASVVEGATDCCFLASKDIEPLFHIKA